MTTFIPSLNRAPGLLFTNTSSANITRTQLDIFRETQKLSTGRDLLVSSDDSVRAAAVTELDFRLERSTQRQQNLDLTAASLAVADDALAEVTDLLNQTRSIALEQLNFGTDAETRRAQSTVITGIIEGLLRTANRESVVGYVFGGQTPGIQPVTDLNGAYQFNGQPGSLVTDTAGVGRLPSTIEATNAVAATSQRVRGSADLDPDLTLDTRLRDIRGAAGQGIGDGIVTFDFNGNGPVQVDLSGLDTIDDVVTQLEFAITEWEATSGNTVLDVGGVGFNGQAITIDVVAGGSLEFLDEGATTAGRDLGLVQVPADPYTDLDDVGADLSPRLTERTPLASLPSLTLPLGSIVVQSNAVTSTVDLSGATTVGDIKQLIEGAAPGVRVEIDSENDRIDVISTISGSSTRALSISEATGTGLTATALGIRSFDDATALADFNFGDGVGVVEGFTDPDDNVDFTINIGDGTNTYEIGINLTSADLATLGTARTATNTQIDAQLTTLGIATTDLEAVLLDGANGLAFAQQGVLTDPISVAQQNNSPLARDLGLLDGFFDAANDWYLGADAAEVRVDSVFTHLIDLREALENDDTFGIGVAADRLVDAIDSIAVTRSTVGVFDRRVQDEVTRLQDQQVTDEAIRSELFDVDFATSASRFSLLQNQLQAGLQTTGITQSLTLLNFI